jgi:hypothetical protein
LTPEELVWDAPNVLLNQMQHAHLYKAGIPVKRATKSRKASEKIKRLMEKAK